MIKIIADSSCNLTDDILKRYDVDVVPITIDINGKTYIDYEEITPQELYDMLPSLKELPTTAAPSPDAFIKKFEKGVEAGIKEFIVITLSSESSATHQSARLAKETYLSDTKEKDIRIHVVDSMCISLGSGYLIMKTGEMINNNASFD